MEEPLVTKNLYEAFGALGEIEGLAERLQSIRGLVQRLEPLNFNTLKFTMAFFRELVEYKSVNKMTSHNCAVAVGANIFRPANHQVSDPLNS